MSWLFYRFVRAAALPSCSSQEFKCVTSGQCIPLAFVCDGDEDCVDGSDEQRTCGMSVKCTAPGKSHRIIFLNRVSKDDSLPGGQTCRSDQFTCQEGQCIPSQYKCDHVKDCVDNSDENNCGKTFLRPQRTYSRFKKRSINNWWLRIVSGLMWILSKKKMWNVVFGRSYLLSTYD